VHDPTNLDAHRAALADALASNDEAVTLAWDNWHIRAGDESVGATTPALLDLVSRMAAHGVRELSFGANSNGAHVLGAAWVLSQEPVIGDGGARAVARLATVGASSVRLVPVVTRPASTTSHVSDGNGVSNGEPVRAPRDAFPFLTAVRAESRETAQALIARLADAASPEQTARALDALTAFTELPRKQITDIVAILSALIAEEPRLTDGYTKRMFVFALRRIAKSSVLRAMAAALAQTPEKRDEYIRIFKYFGDAAAAQVIEELVHADSLKERRVLYDTLIELRRGIPTLISLLGDGRWYVVRNAAELLGEMRAEEAEQGLAWLVNHADARVRRSAATALGQLDTPGAREALREATNDASPDVRMTALLALSNGDRKRVATQIIRDLPNEQDLEAQRMMMLVLGRLGTPQAIQYLLNAAEPEKGFFKRKKTPRRVAALTALADASDPAVVAAIRAMTRDDDPEVRHAAAKALTPAKPRAAAETAAVW
jgi:HEAT repeat protein